MDHAEALKLKATERYFLGEMTPVEREAYEDHYFSCTECALDVKTTAALMDNAREIFRKEAEAQIVGARKRSENVGWFGWMRPAYAMAVVAVLAVFIGYQNLVTIPHLKQGSSESAQALASYSLVTSGSRGSNDLIFHPRPNSPFGLYVDIPASAKYSSYLAEVQNEAGSSKFSVRVSPEQAKETVQLLIPASILNSGRYNLVIRGSNDQNGAVDEIARYPFTVQYNQ